MKEFLKISVLQKFITKGYLKLCGLCMIMQNHLLRRIRSYVCNRTVFYYISNENFISSNATAVLFFNFFSTKIIVKTVYSKILRLIYNNNKNKEIKLRNYLSRTK